MGLKQSTTNAILRISLKKNTKVAVLDHVEQLLSMAPPNLKCTKSLSTLRATRPAWMMKKERPPLGPKTLFLRLFTMNRCQNRAKHVHVMLRNHPGGLHPPTHAVVFRSRVALRRKVWLGPVYMPVVHKLIRSIFRNPESHQRTTTLRTAASTTKW